MKKKIYRICILALTLLAISTGVILNTNGDEYPGFIGENVTASIIKI